MRWPFKRRASGHPRLHEAGGCLACGRAWRPRNWHDTFYEPQSAAFPLCEACWAARTPDERLPFYMHLVEIWGEQGLGQTECVVKRSKIKEAVMAGG